MNSEKLLKILRQKYRVVLKNKALLYKVSPIDFYHDLICVCAAIESDWKDLVNLRIAKYKKQPTLVFMVHYTEKHFSKYKSWLFSHKAQYEIFKNFIDKSANSKTKERLIVNKQKNSPVCKWQNELIILRNSYAHTGKANIDVEILLNGLKSFSINLKYINSIVPM